MKSKPFQSIPIKMDCTNGGTNIIQESWHLSISLPHSDIISQAEVVLGIQKISRTMFNNYGGKEKATTYSKRQDADLLNASGS